MGTVPFIVFKNEGRHSDSILDHFLDHSGTHYESLVTTKSSDFAVDEVSNMLCSPNVTFYRFFIRLGDNLEILLEQLGDPVSVKKHIS